MRYQCSVLLAFFFLFLASSCSKDCRVDAFENKIKWEEARPNHYSFEFRISCFCPVESVGPYYVEIMGTEIDTAYYIGTVDFLDPMVITYLNDYEKVKETVSESTIDAYFDRFGKQEEENNSSFKCEMEFNEEYHFIEVYDIIPPDDIADGDFYYEVSNFTNLD